MTTAHRPTWRAAAGKGSEAGWVSGGAVTKQFAVRDMPAHTKLKFRQEGQGSEADVNKLNMREELLQKEQVASEKRRKEESAVGQELKPLHDSKTLLLTNDPDSKDRENQLRSLSEKFGDVDDSESDSSDSESDSDEDDEEAELIRELEKIKKEREEERQKKEAEAQEEANKSQREEILKGNPLTAMASGSAAVKRRWNDDVVFKNQSRGEAEVKKRFVNDTIRNDFHRRFLNKYIQ